MRLSEWRAGAPVRDALGAKVMAVVTPVLGVLEADPDPQVWVLWGDDPVAKYSILVPTPAGLIWLAVRVNLAGLGPRATAKLIRWPRLQLGELVVETEGPHRMVSFQVDAAILRGADAVADSIGRFALVLIAAVEGHPWPAFDRPRKGRAVSRATAAAGRRAQPGTRVPAPKSAGPAKTSGAAKSGRTATSGGAAKSGRRATSGGATMSVGATKSGGAAKGAPSRTAPVEGPARGMGSARVASRATPGDRPTAPTPKLPALPARTATSIRQGSAAGRGSRG